MPQPGSIKTRITIAIAAIFIPVVIAFSVYVYEKDRQVLTVGLDQGIESVIQMLTGLIVHEGDHIELELMEFVTGQYAQSGSGHYFTVQLNQRLLSQSPSLANINATLERSQFTTIETKTHGDYQILEGTGPQGRRLRAHWSRFMFMGQTLEIIVAIHMDGVIKGLHKTKIQIFLLLPALALLLVFGTIAIVRYTLKPMQSLADHLDKMGVGTLDHSVDEHDFSREFGPILKSFSHMQQRLKKSFAAEKRIVSDASHELKGPLSIILSQCDVTLKNPRPAEAYKTALEEIRNVARMMRSLTQKLLIISALDSGRTHAISCTPLNLRHCVETAIQLTLLKIADRQNPFLLSGIETLTVDGDADKLTEVFTNIFDNSLKYGGHGPITIVFKQSQHQAIVTIQDSGPGIAKEHHTRIFERFYRVDSSRSNEGYGLGLNIAKLIIEAHGGQLSLDPDSTEGACFTVALARV